MPVFVVHSLYRRYTLGNPPDYEPIIDRTTGATERERHHMADLQVLAGAQRGMRQPHCRPKPSGCATARRANSASLIGEEHSESRGKRTRITYCGDPAQLLG